MSSISLGRIGETLRGKVLRERVGRQHELFGKRWGAHLEVGPEGVRLCDELAGSVLRGVVLGEVDVASRRHGGGVFEDGSCGGEGGREGEAVPLGTEA